MIRTITGLAAHLSPEMLAYLSNEEASPDADDTAQSDQKNQSRNQLSRRFYQSGQAKLLETRVTDLNLLVSPIGADHVAQWLRDQHNVPEWALSGEYDRALWLLRHHPEDADHILAATAFDARYERPGCWAGIRLENISQESWASLQRADLLKDAISSAMELPEEDKQGLRLERHKAPETIGSAEAALWSLLAPGRKEAPVLRKAGSKYERTPIQHPWKASLLIDEPLCRLELVAESLPKRRAEKVFEHLLVGSGIPPEQVVRLKPPSPALDDLARTSSFPCTPSEDQIDSVRLSSLTLLRSDLGVLILNTKSGSSERSAVDAWRAWAGQTQARLPFGSVLAASLIVRFPPTESRPDGQQLELKMNVRNGFNFRGWSDWQRRKILDKLGEWELVNR